MTTDKKQPPDTDRPCLVIRSPSREIRTASYRDGRWFLTRDTVLMDGDVIDWRELPSWDRLAILDRYDEERAEWERKYKDANEHAVVAIQGRMRANEEADALRSQVTALAEERDVSTVLIENMKRHIEEALARADRAEKERDEAFARCRAGLSTKETAIDCAEWVERVSLGIGIHYYYDGPFVAAESDVVIEDVKKLRDERDRAIAERDDAVANVAKISERAHEHICGVMVERDRAISERDDLGCQLEALRAVQRGDVAELRTRMEAVEKALQSKTEMVEPIEWQTCRACNGTGEGGSSDSRVRER